jgi:hypothetical protein
MQQTGRSTITVSKAPPYLPRVTATISTIQQKAGNIRTPTPPTVSGTAISPAFVRSITPRTSSPTAVLSQGAWVSGTGAIQVPTQLIRSTITQQNTRTHILQPNSVTVTNNAGNAQTITNLFGQQSAQQQNLGGNTTISVPVSSSNSGNQNQQQQPTYVATVLPQRPQATIVYTSQQQPPFTAIQGPVQRVGIANAANTRQVRPLQRMPTAGIRVNTSSLSIRPNVPGLTPTTVLTSQNRNASGMTTSTSISNTIPARIFQVATSQSSGSQQVIGQQNQKILSANVMTLPIIVNNSRIATHTIKTPLQQQPNIIAHVSKLTSGDGAIISNSITTTIPSNTMVTSIQASNQQQQMQASQGGNQQQGTYGSQQNQQVTNLTTQGGQIITVSQQQQQQLLGNQGNVHQQGGTVVPLQISSRNTNIPIKTITVSTPNSGSALDASNIHRSLSSNSGNLQATTIMPIAKLVSQQQQQNMASAQGNQSASVFIHTRIPSSTISTTNSSQVVSVSAPVSNQNVFSNVTHAGTTVFYEQANVTMAPSSMNASDSKTATSVSAANNEYTVVSSNYLHNEKVIHSIITKSLQQNNASNNNQQQVSSSSGNIQHQQASTTVRYSPMILENQSGGNQQQQHQIITMTGNIIQAVPQQQQQQQHQQHQHQQHQLQQQHQQQQQMQNSNANVESGSLNISTLPPSPRSIGAIRKQNETTPIKVPKKTTKVKKIEIKNIIVIKHLVINKYFFLPISQFNK